MYVCMCDRVCVCVCVYVCVCVCVCEGGGDKSQEEGGVVAKVVDTTWCYRGNGSGFIVQPSSQVFPIFHDFLAKKRESFHTKEQDLQLPTLFVSSSWPF